MNLQINYQIFFAQTIKQNSDKKKMDQIKAKIEESLSAYYCEDSDIYEEMYGQNATIALTVTKLTQEGSSWFVEFTEQGEIRKQANINKNSPTKISVITYEDEEPVFSFS